MPIEYEIDAARSLIRTRCVGATTLDEVLAHFEELRSDAALPERINVLLDLTALATAPERDQLRAIVSEIKSMSSSLRWGVLAIVARTDLVYGMSRILGVFVEDSFTGTNVFRQVREAERWLEGQLGS
jgi:hypothetical protein